jgi:hypothetical protein
MEGRSGRVLLFLLLWYVHPLPSISTVQLLTWSSGTTLYLVLVETGGDLPTLPQRLLLQPGLVRHISTLPLPLLCLWTWVILSPGKSSCPCEITQVN